MANKKIQDIRQLPALKRLAAAQIAAQILRETNPLKTQVGSLRRSTTREVGALSDLYGGLQTAAMSGAQRLKENYEAGQQTQGSIFADVASRLDSLRGTVSSDAQRLAQQIGAPVPLDEFTGLLDQQRAAGTQEGAVQQLGALGAAQAGVQSAEQYASEVVPAMGAEDISDVRSFYGRGIADLQQEIAQIKGERGKRITSRLDELLQQERDFWNSKQALGIEKQRVALERRRVATEERAQKASSAAQKAATQQAKQQRSVANQDRAFAIAEKALLGGGTVEGTAYDFLPVGTKNQSPNRPPKGNKDAFYGTFRGPGGQLRTGWWQMKARKFKDSTPNLKSEPNRVWELLRRLGFSTQLSTSAIQVFFPDWVYGQALGGTTGGGPQPFQ